MVLLLTSIKGYIALAQANFSNSNRIRYGQDFYDERMQATVIVYETISYKRIILYLLKD